MLLGDIQYDRHRLLRFCRYINVLYVQYLTVEYSIYLVYLRNV